jgi:hypothetical protein
MKGEEMSVKNWFIVLVVILAIAGMTFMSGCGGPKEIAQVKDGANDLAEVGLSKDDIKPPPDGWPSAVPISKDILIYSTTGSNSVENKNWLILGVYKYSAADVYNFYKSALSGWTIKLDSGPKNDILEEGSTLQMFTAYNDKYLVEIGIYDIKRHQITISVADIGK